MDRLTGIEIFLRTVRMGGLAAAGRSMNMSGAMAGRYLDALEMRLGMRLFQRTTRKLTLTPLGVEYYDRIERVFNEFNEIEANASFKSSNMEGILRISSPTIFGTTHLIPLIHSFHEKYPEVQIELGLSDRMVDLMVEDWDMAVSIGLPGNRDLVSHRIASLGSSIYGAPSYLARRGRPRNLADLKKHDCLIHSEISLHNLSAWLFGKGGDLRVIVMGFLQSNNMEAIIKASILGYGLIYCPKFMVSAAVSDGHLVDVELDAETYDPGEIYVVTHPSKPTKAINCLWKEYLINKLTIMSLNW